MNLEAKISERLWGEVSSNYESRNYKGAILDSIYFLSDLIRQKTGLEADGVSLAGQAFGGKNPKLKVNALKTESDLNVQQGTEQIMRGVYQAFRNPRSHEKIIDNQEDADSIIVFIDYLLKLIDQSKTCFSKAAFLPRVFDSDFFPNERYAALLVEEVPPRQRAEVFIEVFQKRETGDCSKLTWFLKSLFGRLCVEDQARVLDVVSEELKAADSEGKIRTAIQVLPADAWPKLSEVARLRIENKFINSLKTGKLDRTTKACKGAFGTWSGGLLSYFSLKPQVASLLCHKLDSEDPTEQDYVFEYFGQHLSELAPEPGKYLSNIIKKGLAKGDTRFYNLVFFQFEGPYSTAFEKEISEFKERPVAEVPAQNGPPPEEDDVPF